MSDIIVTNPGTDGVLAAAVLIVRELAGPETRFANYRDFSDVVQDAMREGTDSITIVDLSFRERLIDHVLLEVGRVRKQRLSADCGDPREPDLPAMVH